MANVKVPLKFQIYKGDELSAKRSSRAVIKVGKLASSHLRLDDETVSRMHAVIEAPARTTSSSSTSARPAGRRSTASGSPRRGCSRATRSCSATAAWS